MARYHVKDDGTPGVCDAAIKCPLGTPVDQHHNTPEEARRYYDELRAGDIFGNGSMTKQNAHYEARSAYSASEDWVAEARKSGNHVELDRAYAERAQKYQALMNLGPEEVTAPLPEKQLSHEELTKAATEAERKAKTDERFFRRSTPKDPHYDADRQAWIDSRSKADELKKQLDELGGPVAKLDPRSLSQPDLEAAHKNAQEELQATKETLKNASMFDDDYRQMQENVNDAETKAAGLKYELAQRESNAILNAKKQEAPAAPKVEKTRGELNSAIEKALREEKSDKKYFESLTSKSPDYTYAKERYYKSYTNLSNLNGELAALNKKDPIGAIAAENEKIVKAQEFRGKSLDDSIALMDKVNQPTVKRTKTEVQSSLSQAREQLRMVELAENNNADRKNNSSSTIIALDKQRDDMRQRIKNLEKELTKAE